MSKSKDTLPAVQENKAVAVVDSSLPAFLQGEAAVRPDIEVEDITVPRIKIAQSMSEEVKKGLVKEGDLFLNVSTEVLAQPLRAIFVATGKEFILWRDQNDNGGGIMARAHKVIDKDGNPRYAWDKPNQKFTTKIKGMLPVSWETKHFVDENGLDKFGSSLLDNPESPPAATAHFNYVAVLIDHENAVVAFSLKSSQLKRARDLNYTLARGGKVPFYAKVFEIVTENETNAANQTYKNIRFKPAGLVQDEETFNYAKRVHEDFAAKGFVVDQSNAEKDGEAELPF